MSTTSQYPVLIIPAFNPDEELLKLIDALKQLHPEQEIIVVNDGSKIECESNFKRLQTQGIVVLSHHVNSGKGEALKTGMRYFLSHYPQAPGIVTADADGQHCYEDIIKIRQKLMTHPHQLHLGVREFSEKNIPLRSRLGNGLTRFLYKLVTKTNVQDTQTGLRGIPVCLIQSMIQSKSSRYEFEFEMFFVARKLNISVQETSIQTIYINSNEKSHFNPLLDSVKIYYVFVRFCSVALLSFLVDFILFSTFFYYQQNLVRAMVQARIVSATFNFLLNKNITFKTDNNLYSAIVKYSALATVIGLSSLKLTQFLSLSGLNIYASKIVAEFFLFIVSFLIQNYVIFFKTQLKHRSPVV